MKAYGWFRKALEEAEGTFEYKLEGLELEVTERILQVMQDQGITRSELAQRLNVTKAAVSKLLNDGSNMTLKRLLAVAEALNQELRVDLQPPARRLETKVVQYNPKRQTRGPKFNLVGIIGADDYTINEDGPHHAINEC